VKEKNGGASFFLLTREREFLIIVYICRPLAMSSKLQNSKFKGRNGKGERTHDNPEKSSRLLEEFPSRKRIPANASRDCLSLWIERA
jgi:hypothetical protein